MLKQIVYVKLHKQTVIETKILHLHKPTSFALAPIRRTCLVGTSDWVK